MLICDNDSINKNSIFNYQSTNTVIFLLLVIEVDTKVNIIDKTSTCT
jgi:hypothetical protein